MPLLLGSFEPLAPRKLSPIDAAIPAAERGELVLGAVVEYHGSLRDLHGRAVVLKAFATPDGTQWVRLVAMYRDIRWTCRTASVSAEGTSVATMAVMPHLWDALYA
jgi:hypothetical protein